MYICVYIYCSLHYFNYLTFCVSSTGSALNSPLYTTLVANVSMISYMLRHKVVKLKVIKFYVHISPIFSCLGSHIYYCNEIILLYRHNKAVYIEIYVHAKLPLTTLLHAHNKVSTCIANYLR